MKINFEDLRGALEERLARHHVPGASIAVLCNGELTSAAAGLANVATGVALTDDTVMHIGSITKVLNATLVMQLVDERRVDLAMPVVQYLPDLKLKDRAALGEITVEMLLNHTSGIDGDMLPDHGHDEETIEKGIERFAQLGQIHAPGAEFSYCNAGTVIAGYLVQRLCGKSWYQLIHERIFRPLQMEHSVSLPEEALLHRASVGHYLQPGAQKPTRTSFAFLPLSFGPAGASVMMSARNLVLFASAYLTRGVGANGVRILSEESARAMQAISVSNEGKGYTYIDMGLGWMVTRENLLFHAGGGPGIVAALYAHPPTGFAAAVLTNAEHGLGLINEFMEPWLAELGPTLPFGMANVRPPLAPVQIDVDRYVGVYENVLCRFRVGRAGDGLSLSRQAKIAVYESVSTEEGPAAKLIPLGDDRFLVDVGDGSAAGSAAARIFTFRGLRTDGRMQYIGCIPRLWKRVS
jgi:CubicO group peptidase (beta-lactamase class C family)